MKQKTRHFTNSRPALFPTITAHPFLYSVPLLPQFLHCRRRTIETGKPFTLLPENGWGRKKSFSCRNRAGFGLPKSLF
ncbi:hypothetical protein CXT96_08360 [Akkermansia muciniphila]|nr:hypothetical protein CXT92_06735 [Akkermansia muciniphila]PNC93064.1 hypothetical protein CXT91_01450 [Akkermansia muciniphila]PND14350.1 hypothetical protein CXT96_08360 [Akkermansia muciniphila]QAA36682.1 hypothetical protein C1I88_07130 [Akkermansia muciniphila]QHV14123.1 hypothetical protein C5O09_07075 [Akkermansia muciniphila]